MLNLNRYKEQERCQCFGSSLDSIVMFACVFMTSTAVLQSQDTIKVFLLPAINILFMAMEVRGKS